MKKNIIKVSVLLHGIPIIVEAQIIGDGIKKIFSDEDKLAELVEFSVTRTIDRVVNRVFDRGVYELYKDAKGKEKECTK